jgi:hypothetical protein
MSGVESDAKLINSLQMIKLHSFDTKVQSSLCNFILLGLN